jgi:hypothetical protein
LKTSNLILDFEFDQHLESHKHVINIIMWFRDMGCYTTPLLATNPGTLHHLILVCTVAALIVTTPETRPP